MAFCINSKKKFVRNIQEAKNMFNFGTWGFEKRADHKMGNLTFP